MDYREKLLSEIEQFIAVHKMTESTFGFKAVNDGKFVGRLRKGKRFFRETEDKVRQFMDKFPK